MKKKIKSSEWIGKWVRFYSNGEIVLAVVQYVREDDISRELELCTDKGTCSPDEVLESR